MSYLSMPSALVVTAAGGHMGFRDRDVGRGLIGFVVMTLFVAALVALVVVLVRSARAPHAAPAAPVGPPVAPPVAPPAADSALAHLRVRYARGEVDRQQYLQMADDLGAPVPQPAPPSPPAPPAP